MRISKVFVDRSVTLWEIPPFLERLVGNKCRNFILIGGQQKIRAFLVQNLRRNLGNR